MLFATLVIFQKILNCGKKKATAKKRLLLQTVIANYFAASNLSA